MGTLWALVYGFVSLAPTPRVRVPLFTSCREGVFSETQHSPGPMGGCRTGAKGRALGLTRNTGWASGVPSSSRKLRDMKRAGAVRPRPFCLVASLPPYRSSAACTGNLSGILLEPRNLTRIKCAYSMPCVVRPSEVSGYSQATGVAPRPFDMVASLLPITVVPCGLSRCYGVIR